MTVERLEGIATKAILGGYGRVLTHGEHLHRADGSPYARNPLGGRVRRIVELQCSMDCETPHAVELFSRDSVVHGKPVKPLTVVVYSRCRKCTACMERRRVFWSGRAITEYQNSVRTLFGTLTVSPENDMMIDALARIEHAEMGVDFDKLEAPEKFRARCAVGGREVTKWIKRLRATEDRPTVSFRYLLVAEAHNGPKTTDEKRGRPHWHCLIHETDPAGLLVTADEWARNDNGEHRTDRYGNPLVSDNALVRSAWKAGFSSFALCRTPLAAGYVCKYLTKEDAHVRIRASQAYGKPTGTPVDAARQTREKNRPQQGEGDQPPPKEASPPE